MSAITVPARKFMRLFDYLERIGLDVPAIAAAVELRRERIAALDPEHALPAMHYSRLYRAAAMQMQQFEQPLSWGAGVGGEAFDLMCHCMIGARTLRDALHLGERFDNLHFRQYGYRMRVVEQPTEPKARLSYTIELPEGARELIPENWDRAGHTITVLRSSGLRTWHAYCSWLIGQVLTTTEVRIDAPPINREYQDSLERLFSAPVYFDAGENSLSFDPRLLDRRLVQTTESLAEFLNNTVYHLMAIETSPASTSSAIKSLLALNLPNGTPSFAEIAAMLYMSESSLRRRLQGEQTSYQAIKDEVRCQVAIDKLLHDDARVADLAELLGFTETSSFVRSFKSWTGQTPKAYKDNMQSLGRA
ncbi:MAG: AraC family transcriptional regulator ligand-binding domain-containing protein [Halioglobus sp.]|nr:AraC family transcriptional regulator ligand-binding domain-containing protein [Halioglobus sp.]MCB1708455.1 AraC family transcriptional regulator ligand-binding domain-containing protein [Halioglobus sp.]MCP5121940.1 AraC family transcriptional regulator ligand-binding domain-containing protein [Pseudomonadales bacterium]MCP5192521.1 AraC family transcriptional regulator ligand-binding domain-containing protein [Pseudomonadales bacterium]